MSNMNTHCPVCTGLGTHTLPQGVISPGVVDLMHRTETCEACGGTGVLDTLQMMLWRLDHPGTLGITTSEARQIEELRAVVRELVVYVQSKVTPEPHQPE